MSEVTGTIETVETKEAGGAKLNLTTDDGQQRTLHIAKNYEGSVPAQGSRGKATFHEWTPDGFKYALKMVDGWEVLEAAAPSPNGSSAPEPTPSGRSDDNRDASFALSYAKDIVVAMVEFQGLKDPKDVVGYWLNFADKAVEWFKTNG